MRMSIALLSLVISVYSAGAQDNSVLTYHGDAARSGNFAALALTWEKARSLNLDRAFDARVAATSMLSRFTGMLRARTRPCC